MSYKHTPTPQPQPPICIAAQLTANNFPSECLLTLYEYPQDIDLYSQGGCLEIKHTFASKDGKCV